IAPRAVGLVRIRTGPRGGHAGAAVVALVRGCASDGVRPDAAAAGALVGLRAEVTVVARDRVVREEAAAGQAAQCRVAGVRRAQDTVVASGVVRRERADAGRVAGVDGARFSVVARAATAEAARADAGIAVGEEALRVQGARRTRPF